MRYRLNSAWPVGSAVIPSGIIVDTTKIAYLAGVVPPPDVTPLDQATRRDWLVKAYYAHPFTIQPVGSG